MPSKRYPKYEDIIDGIRVRVFATRSEYEVIFNDDDIADPKANVLCFPKFLGLGGAARQGRLEYKPDDHS